MSGYLYFATNPAMPGLTKIGFSESILSDRFTALQSTGVPLPFELYAALLVEDAPACERAVHGALTNERLAGNREFFRVSAKDALARVLFLLLAHTAGEQNDGETQVVQFSDLDDTERDVLAALAMAPTHQRPVNWEWLERMFNTLELDARYILHCLKTKGYLREISRARKASFYDLAPRGVEYGRIAREDPEFINSYGDPNVFLRGLGRW